MGEPQILPSRKKPFCCLKACSCVHPTLGGRPLMKVVLRWSSCQLKDYYNIVLLNMVSDLAATPSSLLIDLYHADIFVN